MSIGQEGCTGAKRFQYDPFTQQNGNTLGCVTSGEARFKKTTNFYEGKKENLLFGASEASLRGISLHCQSVRPRN